MREGREVGKKRSIKLGKKNWKEGDAGSGRRGGGTDGIIFVSDEERNEGELVEGRTKRIGRMWREEQGKGRELVKRGTGRRRGVCGERNKNKVSSRKEE